MFLSTENFIICRLFQKVNCIERIERIKRGRTVLYGISDSSCLPSIYDYFFPRCWCKTVVQFYKPVGMKWFEFWKQKFDFYLFRVFSTIKSFYNFLNIPFGELFLHESFGNSTDCQIQRLNKFVIILAWTFTYLIWFSASLSVADVVIWPLKTSRISNAGWDGSKFHLSRSFLT